ncbi:pyrroline-5-carboxylate reductase [Acetomicrobium sp.]|jgi:pyrroline-5-carboxylate reductase|uniref:pyrroline-5-carboxylate reductase n=1 Tax=Acetomicrobium sp. TaxID=1872099 RepID=UPI003D95DA12
MEKEKVTIIGAGVIGGAIACAICDDFEVTATRRKLERLSALAEKGIKVTTNNEEAVSEADIVIISVKPHQVIPLLKSLSRQLADKLVISFAASINIDLIQRVIPRSRIVRAMTNIAVQVKEGYTVYSCGKGIKEEDHAIIGKIFEDMGEYEEVEEQYLDVLTAMAGSSPAYLYTVVEAMIYGALHVGLPRDLALRSAAWSVIGASHLLLSSGKHPAELRDMVVTPGGVTIDAIYALEDGKVRTAFMKAILDASLKAKALSKAACIEAEKQIES